jgi:hypothetical protein
VRIGGRVGGVFEDTLGVHWGCIRERFWGALEGAFGAHWWHVGGRVGGEGVEGALKAH